MNAGKTLEQQNMDKAMAALETLSTVWAAQNNIRDALQKMLASHVAPDFENRMMAFVMQVHMEGLYEGYHAPHQAIPTSTKPV